MLPSFLNPAGLHFRLVSTASPTVVCSLYSCPSPSCLQLCIRCPYLCWQHPTQQLLLFALVLCSPTEIVAFSDRISEFQALNCNVSCGCTWQQQQR